MIINVISSGYLYYYCEYLQAIKIMLNYLFKSRIQYKIDVNCRSPIVETVLPMSKNKASAGAGRGSCKNLQHAM